MTTMTQPKPTYKRGDVILVLYPDSNLRTAKLRPALVVQADNLQTGLPQVIVAMITGKMFRANHPSRITVLLSTPEGQQSGLLSDSVVRKWFNPNSQQATVIPDWGGRDLKLGTVRSAVRQLGIDWQDFQNA